MTPRIEYDPGLVEQAVHHAVYGDAKREAALHRETNRLYRLPDSRDRDTAFVRTFGLFFERLGLDSALRRLLAERPIIGESIGACIVGPTVRARHESAELLVRGHEGEIRRNDRTLMLQILPETLADAESLDRRVRPELLHIADMVDPAFRYRRSQIEGLPARRNLIKDRYRVLWDVYIMGRLTREGFCAGVSRSRLSAQLAQVFGIETEEAADLAFVRLFDAASVTHDQLFAWANAPDELLGPGRRTAVADSARPGANCRLCGFSTFDWFAFDTEQAELVQAIENRHPTWTPTDGACRQCVEIYAFAERGQRTMSVQE